MICLVKFKVNLYEDLFFALTMTLNINSHYISTFGMGDRSDMETFKLILKFIWKLAALIEKVV